MAAHRRLTRAPKIATFLLVLLLASVSCSPPTVDDDLDGLDELLAIDAEEDEGHHKASAKPSEAEVLTRAQSVVRELSNENAGKVLDGGEPVLLLGYTPWCHRSAELMPRFAEAAMRLREMGSSVLAAKIDAERHAKAAALLGIKGFPTVLLFVNGSALPYAGGLTGEEIVIWVQKKTGAPVIRLSSVSAVEKFVVKHPIFAVGFFKNFEGPNYDEFVKAAKTNNEIQFVEANDISIAEVLFPHIGTEKDFIGLVKGEPERFEKFEGNFEEEKILNFIEYNKFPLVTNLTELNSARVYSSPIKLQVFVFAEVDDFKGIILPLQEVARKYKKEIMFVYVDSAEDNLARPFLTLFGLEPEKPIVTAFDNRAGSKYLLEADLAPNNLEEFCSGLLRGTLSPYFKSEPKPDTTGIIEKVVGRTFDASILDNTKNVFLEVYTPWCMDCEATSKQIEKLAKHFKGQDNLKFARIDASVNEHPKLQVDNYPTLMFYPAADKSNPIKVSKKSSLKQLVDFVKDNTRSDGDGGISASEEAKKDEL